MSEVEIEISSGEKCSYCGQGMKAEGPAESKDSMLAELKGLLNDSTQNGMAERQVKIDELMSKISEYGKEED
jgi:hypothetical protein